MVSYGCFSHYHSRVGYLQQRLRVWEAQDIYSLDMDRKSFLTPTLDVLTYLIIATQ